MKLIEAISYCLAIVVFSFNSFLGGIEAIQKIAYTDSDKTAIRVIQLETSQDGIQSAGEQKRQAPDFDALEQSGADIIGWMRLEEVYIDDPIVKGKDSDYYLSHAYRSPYNPAGSLFADYRADTGFASQNTAIYGYNLKNGTMFAKLKKYQDQRMYEAQPIITIYMPGGKVYYYHIFAVVLADASFDCTKPEYGDGFTNFVNSLRRQSRIASNAKVASSDRIVCLSTCHGANADERLVVAAVLLNQDGEEIDISGVKP
jgi:sortase B